MRHRAALALLLLQRRTTMYRVLHHFHDLTDYKATKAGNIYHEYEPGDTYPRQGVDVSPERVAMLASAENALGMPLIENIGQEELAGADQAEMPVQEMPVEPQKETEEKPRRSRKAKKETS